MLSEKYKEKKLLVIGDLMIDHYMWGTCERISPEAPVPVVDIYKEDLTLGGAGNVIQNLCSFGLVPDVLSVIGKDEAALEIRRMLELDGVSSDGLYEEDSRITSKKTRVIAANHHMVRIDKETKVQISSDAENFIIGFVRDHITEYHLILFSDYLKGVLTERVLKNVIELCLKYGVPTIVDPKGTDFSKYKGVSFIKPNKKEASIATGISITNVSQLELAAQTLKDSLNCSTVIITLSEEGMAIYDGQLDIIPTKAKEVFDVTGAGDTVLASLGICLADGVDIKEACRFANHAAAIVVSRVGSAVTTVEEVYKHIAEEQYD